MAKQTAVREAFKDIRTLLKERADSSRDVQYELVEAGLVILEQVVNDLHEIALAARDYREMHPVT